MDKDSIFIEAKESGERIDALLARKLDSFSRSAIQHLLENGDVLLNGKVLKKNYRSSVDDVYEIILPELSDVPLEPQNIPLDIRYEDEWLIVVNKPRGLVVHPAPGHSDGTLVNALLYHCGDSLSGIGGEKRPGIIHRIDKDTSGLIVIAKNDFAHQFLSSQLSDHTLAREYEAVACGRFKETAGTVNRPIGRSTTDRKKMAVTDINSRQAITHWKVKDSYKDYTHIICNLETGRTHQIRVHMASLGHPLLGDGIYGAKCPDKGLEGQCLHARRVKFIHPQTRQEMCISSELPDYFLSVLDHLGPKIE